MRAMIRLSVPLLALSLLLAAPLEAQQARRVDTSTAKAADTATAPLTRAERMRRAMQESAARGEYVRANYRKSEVRIPMRDGVQLFATVYTPNDAAPGNTYPILMQRTPYSAGPYGLEPAKYRRGLGQTMEMDREGYIFVFQDVRGKYMSEGEFVNMRPVGGEVDETTDTWDTVDWLVKNLPHNNGRVGLWGISYPGFYAAAGAINGHPALVAVSPQAPIANWFLGDDMHRNGAFNLNLSLGFFNGFGFGYPRPQPTPDAPKGVPMGTPDGYQYYLDLGGLANAPSRFREPIPFWDEIVAHPDYDEFWQSRDLPSRLDNVRAAVLTVGGWYDTEDLYGPLHVYRAMEERNPGIRNTLVMGPWTHGGWLRGEGRHVGDSDFGSDTARHYQPLEFAFFKHHLKGGPAPDLPEVLAFQTGRNQWRRFEQWPPRQLQTRVLYFQPEGGLALDRRPQARSSFAEFPSDPMKPVPYSEEIMPNWSRDYMGADQRFAGRRPDVVVYRSEPLAEDITLAGPLAVKLWVSTSAGDADWIVKLIDEYPPDMPGQDDFDGGMTNRGGQQTLVRGEPMRGRYRNSFEHPEPFVPNRPTAVNFRMNDVLHTFKKGHRIMVQVQSTWFPYIDRNPQKYVPNIYLARDEDFIKATHRVYQDARHPSAIEVGVLTD
ncbi:CocE/NonD family hydrolase [Luteimonas sp. e5]